MPPPRGAWGYAWGHEHTAPRRRYGRRGAVIVCTLVTPPANITVTLAGRCGGVDIVKSTLLVFAQRTGCAGRGSSAVAGRHRRRHTRDGVGAGAGSLGNTSQAPSFQMRMHARRNPVLRHKCYVECTPVSARKRSRFERGITGQCAGVNNLLVRKNGDEIRRIPPPRLRNHK